MTGYSYKALRHEFKRGTLFALRQINNFIKDGGGVNSHVLAKDLEIEVLEALDAGLMEIRETIYFGIIFIKERRAAWEKRQERRLMQQTENYEISQAIKILLKALREDPGYRIGWQANIAMAFKDEWQLAYERLGYIRGDDIHEIANKAADRFLEALERDQKTLD